MSKHTVIRAERLGKKYLIGHQVQRERYTALRDVIARRVTSIRGSAANLFRKRAMRATQEEEFWALKDVDFDIGQGDVVGIIGPNGAGKSTLLKILSRVTEPSEGRVTIAGRVGSLLEVGTGFHPELTGRENIYLNGAILGMSRAEINRKFDEIVDFAGVAKFLDTPVKRFSSGMYVRLAFAVAAHLEPDILVVDEVLAVGDAEFQKKCLGKMSDVAKCGRTVLFVSHSMGAVASLCETALLLQNGQVKAVGRTDKIIEEYMQVSIPVSQACFIEREGMPSITGISLDQEAVRRGHFSAQIEFVSPYPLRPPVGGFIVSTLTGVPVWGTNGRFHPADNRIVSAQRGTLECSASSLPLLPSTYTLSGWLGDWHQDFDQKLNVLSFDFNPNAEVSLRPDPNAIGHIDWHASWTVNEASLELSGHTRQ
nr:vitamin B12 import ATP-binding protein BtuD [uncultured bacterium]